MNAWTAWAVKNSVVMICWTVLAVVFGKWWVALFAAACLSGLETRRDTDG